MSLIIGSMDFIVLRSPPPAPGITLEMLDCPNNMVNYYYPTHACAARGKAIGLSVVISMKSLDYEI